MTLPTTPPLYFSLSFIGAVADQPDPTIVPVMSLYWATDNSTFYVSDGAAWNAIGGGGGGISSWGQVSTAQYSGAGSPSGTVTPDAEGDLYVDTTTPAIWQATGTGDTDWQVIAGSQPATRVATQLAAALWSATVNEDYDAGSSVSPGSFGTAVTSIPISVSAASSVASAAAVAVTRIPIDTDVLDVHAVLYVTDLTCTNIISVDLAASTTAGDTSITLNWADAVATVVAGTDLSWDGAFVNSTLGGIFMASLTIQAFWD